ncbi:MAG: hypothetical protein MUE97_05190 [Phycisphaerales bacterium]|jgi:hypothetical protein|nr:hypothetical protein [Phycisphaerales bacterium]
MSTPSRILMLLACIATSSLAHSTLALQASSPPARSSPSPTSAPATSVPTPTSAADDLRRQWQDAYFASDFDKAATLLTSLTKLDDASPVDFYNLACVLAKLGRHSLAETALRDAISRGFGDFDLLIADPDLKALKDTDVYQAVLQGWAELQDATIDGRLAALQRDYPGKHRVVKLDDLRIALAAATSQRGVDEATAELQRAATLWQQWISPPTIEAQPAGPSRPPAWVLVWLPDAPSFQAWTRQTFGPRAGSVGGLYTSHTATLVARDLGPTLRHEFWHVLHHRDMHRRAGTAGRASQQHPLWIQEGLCSLIEDLDTSDSAMPAPAPSWRTNMARRMLDTRGIMPLADFIALTDQRFMGSGSLGRYAHARAIFLFLHTRGKLPAFYASYVHTYGDDRTGRLALEAALGQPLAQIDKDFRAWLRTLPTVGEAGFERVSLPIDLGDGAGEGVVVLDLPLEDQLKFGVGPGDLVVAVAGQIVRDRNDLARALEPLKAGQDVTVTIRTRSGERERRFTLQPK